MRRRALERIGHAAPTNIPSAAEKRARSPRSSSTASLHALNRTAARPPEPERKLCQKSAGRTLDAQMVLRQPPVAVALIRSKVARLRDPQTTSTHPPVVLR